MGSQCAVNFTPLSPLSFLERAAAVHPDAVAVIYGQESATWRLTLQRCTRLATALRSLGVAKGDTVSILSPNVPAIHDAHFGVPMAGAVLNAVNIRLDPPTVAHILRHGGAKALLVHRDFLSLACDALRLLEKEQREGKAARKGHGASPFGTPLATLVVINDTLVGTVTGTVAGPYSNSPDAADLPSLPISVLEYDSLLLLGDPNVPMESFLPQSELDPIALNYTSGTTSLPKGVLYTHRGAYLNSLSIILMSSLTSRAVYLWTLPMFHCNGWCFPWALAALSGTNICMRQVDAPSVYRSLVDHDVDMLCGAPTVLTMILNADEQCKAQLLENGKKAKKRQKRTKVITGGAPPPATVLGQMEELGFEVHHTYGLTETYGPGTICEWKEEEWDGLPLEERARLKSRQGVWHLGLQRVKVLDPETMREVPWDGETMGEVMFRGNTVMEGYANDKEATEKVFKGGWFHSGDLGVVHHDGYMQLRDRSKDIIISGGENISTIQVEGALYQHPKVLEAAVVAMPDEKWGETPCAFVTLKGVQEPLSHGFVELLGVEAEIKEFCKRNLPRFMAPTRVVFGALPKTSTGKVQKFKLREVVKSMAGLTGESKARSRL